MCSWLEYFVRGAPGVPLEETIDVPEQKIPKDGWMELDDRPGFGLGIKKAGSHPIEFCSAYLSALISLILRSFFRFTEPVKAHLSVLNINFLRHSQMNNLPQRKLVRLA